MAKTYEFPLHTLSPVCPGCGHVIDFEVDAERDGDDAVGDKHCLNCGYSGGVEDFDLTEIRVSRTWADPKLDDARAMTATSVIQHLRTQERPAMEPMTPLCFETAAGLQRVLIYCRRRAEFRDYGIIIKKTVSFSTSSFVTVGLSLDSSRTHDFQFGGDGVLFSRDLVLMDYDSNNGDVMAQAMRDGGLGQFYNQIETALQQLSAKELGVLSEVMAKLREYYGKDDAPETLTKVLFPYCARKSVIMYMPGVTTPTEKLAKFHGATAMEMETPKP